MKVKNSIYQEKTGSCAILRDSAYSATSQGLDSFVILNGIHSSEPVFHAIKSDHPTVDLQA